jgi:hypothetical protein
MKRTIAIALTLLAATCASARAETVFVTSGGELAQGWVVPHDSDCWLVTVAHALRNKAISVVGAGGREGQVDASTIVRDPDAAHDLAVMKVVGGIANPCPPSPLGDQDDIVELTRIKDEDLTVNYERRDVVHGKPVALVTLKMRMLGTPEESNAFYTIRPDRDADALQQTASGGVIRISEQGVDAGTPVGMVDEVYTATTGAKVLRWKVVLQLLEAQFAAGTLSAGAAGAGFSIVDSVGSIPGSSCLPLNLMAPGSRCGWRAQEPSPGRHISLTLGFDGQHAARGVAVRFASGDVPGTIEVSTRSDGSDWAPEIPCPVPPSGSVECRFGERMISNVRITVDGKKAEFTAIRVIDVNP